MSALKMGIFFLFLAPIVTNDLVLNIQAEAILFFFFNVYQNPWLYLDTS